MSADLVVDSGMSETAIAAVLGMGVVFLFLAVLSALMFLTRLATERATKAAAATAASLQNAGTDARWVAAAVAAYLAVANAESAVTAKPWQRGAQRRGGLL
jgi:Na+-transporting methylmalonyl-CoA/oxaloacetate decarboxylase gamma subunit